MFTGKQVQPVILNEVKDLALLLARSFAVLRMTSLRSEKTHTSEATYELISGV